MEYSKEDLMEAKKQIWGVGENMGTEESKKIWEENAQFWDNAMGDESNEFHREVVRPKVTELLSPNPADYILDIACGNGNYSSYLAQRGASVVAFDYSKKMIELAKRRQSQYAKQIEFCVADATNRKSILELKRNRAFTMMDSCEEMMIQDWHGALYKKDDTAYLCWTVDPEVSYVLEYTPSKMPDSEIIKMAESAAPMEEKTGN